MIEFNRSFLGVPVTEEQIIALNEAYQRKIEVQPLTVRRFKFHKDELRDKIIKSELKPVEVRELIKDTVCELTYVKFQDVKGNNRLGQNVLARKLIGYFTTEHTPFSLGSIGEYLGLINTYGSGDHTVILYYKKVVNNLIDAKDPHICGWIEEVERELIRKISNLFAVTVSFEDRKHVLSQVQKDFILERYRKGAKIRELSRLCKIHRNTVSKIVNKDRYKP
jgi:hypothetical protein